MNLDSLLSILPALSVVIALVYYTQTLRNANKTQELAQETRRAQLYMQLFLRITSVEFMKRNTEVNLIQFKDFDDFYGRFLSETGDMDLAAKWWSVLWHIDGLGYMLKENLVDPEIVYNFGGGAAIQLMIWQKWEPIIMEYRKRFHSPDFLKWFEYLIGEMLKMRAQQEQQAPPPEPAG